MPSSESVTIRTLFFAMTMGIIDNTSRNLLQPERRTNSPASRVEIKSARLERIPLHSFATSMSIVGKRSTNPSLKTETSSILSIQYATVAEPACKKRIKPSTNLSGIGTSSKRKNNGKAALAKARRPYQNTNPENQTTTIARLTNVNSLPWTDASTRLSASHQTIIPARNRPEPAIGSALTVENI